MANTEPSLLCQTAHTASFAFREYFRPLVYAVRLLKSGLVPPTQIGPGTNDPVSLEVARALLRQRLARERRHEKVLLLQGVISAIGSFLALAIALISVFDFHQVILLALIPLSGFTLWVLVRLIGAREVIAEAKTIRWVINSLDRETAEQVVKQVSWGKPEKQHKSKKNKPRPALPAARTGATESGAALERPHE